MNGFKASATTKFPTTGFPNAKFQLIMTGSQTDWSYTVPVNQGNGVSVDGNGYVTLNSKPSGDVTVRATLISNTSVFYDYTFNPTTVWAVPQVGNTNLANAITTCGGESNLFTRAELSNSPRNAVPVGWQSDAANFFTRAIDGSFLGEWGRLNNATYPSSQWVNSWYWTQDVHAPGNTQFVVHIGDGDIVSTGMHLTSNYAACRG